MVEPPGREAVPKTTLINHEQSGVRDPVSEFGPRQHVVARHPLCGEQAIASRQIVEQIKDHPTVVKDVIPDQKTGQLAQRVLEAQGVLRVQSVGMFACDAIRKTKFNGRHAQFTAKGRGYGTAQDHRNRRIKPYVTNAHDLHP